MNLSELSQSGYLSARWDVLQFDPVELGRYYEDAIRDYPGMTPYGKHGVTDYRGWSILSSDGDPLDGFQLAHLDPTVKIRNSDFTIPTPLMRDYMTTVVGFLDMALGGICRARVMVADPTYDMKYHVDCPPRTEGFWRAHLVLKTHPDSVLRWQVGARQTDLHIPLDGRVYFVRTDIEHRVPAGTETRAHMIFDLVDPDFSFRDLDPLTPGAHI